MLTSVNHSVVIGYDFVHSEASEEVVANKVSRLIPTCGF
jgi:hypothetical protein